MEHPIFSQQVLRSLKKKNYLDMGMDLFYQ